MTENRLLVVYLVRLLAIVIGFAGGSLWAQSLAVSPSVGNLTAAQAQQFSVTGAAPGATVTWSLDPPIGGGTISSTGLYTAPTPISVAKLVTVIATTSDVPAKRAEATVRLSVLSVSVTPGSVTMTAAGTKQFSASVSPGTAEQRIVWSLNPAGLGSISTSGLYTAPSSITATQTVRVIAASAADPTRGDSAVVTLNPLNITVAPVRATLTVSQTRQFSVNSTNGPETVTWSVDPPGMGAVTLGGLYTAPNSIPLEVEARVIAKSTVDLTRIAVGTVVLQPLRLTVSPATGTLTITQTRQFTASVQQGADARVTWRVDPPTGAGTISAGGLYTAPASIPTDTTLRVIATSVVDTSRAAAATIQLNPLDVSISPARSTLSVNETRQFTASVPNGAPAQMVWNIDPAGRGSVSAAGLYRAPASISAESTVQVIARSAIDNTRFAAATVTLSPLDLNVTPATITLRGGQTRQFNAKVGGADASVAWRINPVGAGSISATGVYIAPASVSAEATVQVIATSSLDPSVTASANVRLRPSDISVTPANVSLTVGETRQFNAQIQGGGGVTWRVDPPGQGTVTTAGLYTAPSAIPMETTVRVTATGVTDPTDSAFGLVTLTPQDLSISPSTFTLTVDQTRQFAVRGPGNTSPAVTWTVEPATGAGTVSNAGLYRAPPSIATETLVRVVATLVSDPLRKLTAVVTLQPLDLRVSPLTTSLRGGQTQQFSIRVQSGAPDTVTWSISPAGAGSINSAGLYTAPASVASASTVRIIATSTVDTARTAEATVTFRAADLDIFPLTSTLRAGGTVLLRARVLNAGDQTVTWSLNGPGTISTAGLYTAPAAIAAQTLVTVTATSVANPAVFGTATITLQTCTGLCVTVSPKSISLESSQTQQFTAAVSTGTAGVTWSISPNRGTISATGLYTAPAGITAQETVTVTATSVADATRVDSGAISLLPPLASPRIISVSPPTGLAGDTVTVTVSTVGTAFSPATTTASFGPGIRVGGAADGAAGPVSVTSPTTLTATLAVAGNANAGPRAITLSTGTQIITSAARFYVNTTLPPLVLSSVTPAQAQAAVDKVSVTAANFPSGSITGGAVTVLLESAVPGQGPNVTIASADVIQLGEHIRTVTFSLPSVDILTPVPYLLSVSGATTSGSFSTGIKATLTLLPRARVISLTPGAARAGETVTVTIAAENAGFLLGVTKAQFSSGISVGGSPAGEAGPIIVLNANLATASVAIAAGAASGPRTLSVDTGGRVLTLADAFQVNSGVPAISLLQPQPAIFTNTSPITVRGTVSDPSATVLVNGIAAPVTGGSFVVQVPLTEGNNTITAVAVSGTLAGTATVQVTLDTSPPRATVLYPADGSETASAVISVSGSVNDLVVGTVNSQQVSVSVNDVAATVSNRSFLATAVSLNLGENVIRIVARDQSGNSATSSLRIKRSVPLSRRIVAIAGNAQSGAASTLLPQPLVVAVTDAAGTPQPNSDVVFKAVQNSGSLNGGGAAIKSFQNGGLTQSIVVRTNVTGRASVLWTLGSRSGAGSQRVDVSAAGITGTVSFIATASPGPAAAIVVDSGLNQYGATGSSLPKPFVVVVTDRGHNRLANVPVTFSVIQGGGSINSQSSTTQLTDSDGRAMATLILGPTPGIENNVVGASAPGTESAPAIFSASGKRAGDPSATRITGVVLDNSNNPLPGVTIRLFAPYHGQANNVPIPVGPVVRTGLDGQFSIPGAPVGKLKLMADGGTTTKPGSWPTVEYDLVTVAGADNTVGMPIFLPQIETAERLCVSETTGGVMTLSKFPGFSLTIAPGSATFPGGSRSGCVTATPVHMDRIPMVPGFGQQPRFVVTIQPVGATFNPPAQLVLPNVDGLTPGSTTEMYSFDHDLSAFVSIGTASVSVDGLTIRSDPGVGVGKAGWHCGGNPAGGGAASSLSVSLAPEFEEVRVGQALNVAANGSATQDTFFVNWNALGGGAGAFTSQPSCPNQAACSAQIVFNRDGEVSCSVGMRCTQTNAFAQAQPRPARGCDPKLALVTPSPIRRGSNVEAKIETVCQTVTISDWKFISSEGDGVTITRPLGEDGQRKWSGVAVAGGQITVKVKLRTDTWDLSVPFAVESRDFRFVASAPQQQPQGFVTPGNGFDLAMPAIPQNSEGGIGKAAGDLAAGYQSNIVGSGPNQGYRYIESARDSFDQGGITIRTQFYFALHNELESPPGVANTASPFWKAQCGNYNAASNPGGFIAPESLRQNVRKHEAGPARSHYASYKRKQDEPNVNIGVWLEKYFKFGISDTEFRGTADSTITDRHTTLYNYTADHANFIPQGSGVTGSQDEGGVFTGFINFSAAGTYTACPQ